jgi:phage repressor protein C with HTH and peptisase S24 domain
VETDSNGAFALRVRGDSMEPEFNEGVIIIVNPSLKQEHNDYLVVSNEEGETQIVSFCKLSLLIKKFTIIDYRGILMTAKCLCILKIFT